MPTNGFTLHVLLIRYLGICGQSVCLTNFIWHSISNPKCHIMFSKIQMSVNWHIHLILKCCLNFGLHLGKSLLWILKIQSWFVTKQNNQSSISIHWSWMFLQMLLIAQSTASTSSQQREISRGKCLNTLDERCTCQARRIGSEGVGKTCPLVFWLGGALLDLIGGLLE